MGRCVIIGAGNISDYDEIRKMIKSDDTIVCADAGCVHAENMSLHIDCVIGDFDSSESPDCDDIIKLPVEKDVTDTQYCAQEFVKRGFKDFLLVGMGGGRFDHSYSNVQTLYYLSTKKCNAVIADEINKIYLLTDNERTIKYSGYDNISFFAFVDSVKDLNIEGAKYQLRSYDLGFDDPLCVSNSFISGNDIVIKKDTGTLLVIESK